MSFKPSFTRRAHLLPTRFLAEVSMVLTMLLAVSNLVILTAEFGGIDLSDTDAAIASVIQVGLLVTVLVIVGAAGMTLSTGSAKVVLRVPECVSSAMTASHLAPPVAPPPCTSTVARW